MNLYIATILSLTLMMGIISGCSASINFTDIAFSQKVDGSGTGTMKTEADGLTNSASPTQDASGSAATQGAMAALEGIKDSVAKYLPVATSSTDNSVVSSVPTAPAAEKPPQTPEVKPPLVNSPVSEDPVIENEEVSVPIPGVSESLEYNSKESYNSYGVRNGRQAWRINKKGTSFGPGPIKFVFSSGKEFTVANTSKNCRDQASCSRNSSAPMYGFVYKPGIGPNGEGDSDTGTSHGGVYLHAPWKDSSTTVTVYYNK